MTLKPTTSPPALSLPLTGGGSTDDLALGTGTEGRFTLVVFFRGLTARCAGRSSPSSTAASTR
jgi:hypothetical protein